MLYHLIIAVFLSAVAAWPTAVFEEASLIYNATDADITASLEKAYKLLKVVPRQLSFNPQNQFVPTTGQYAFQSPNYAAGDQRGNCPGLNALANHGYLPRNGVGTTAQFTDAVYRGMSHYLLRCFTYSTNLSQSLAWVLMPVSF